MDEDKKFEIFIGKVSELFDTAIDENYFITPDKKAKISVLSSMVEFIKEGADIEAIANGDDTFSYKIILK